MMGMDQPSILITKVSNGWIVKIPTNEPGLLAGMGGAKGMASFAKGIKEAMHGEDDVLSKIRDTDEEENKAMIFQENDTHVFSQFKDVLGFLKLTIDE